MITLYIFQFITILVIFATYVEGVLRVSALTFHVTILVTVKYYISDLNADFPLSNLELTWAGVV